MKNHDVRFFIFILGFDIPDDPYPRVNDTASIQKERMTKHKTKLLTKYLNNRTLLFFINAAFN